VPAPFEKLTCKSRWRYCGNSQDLKIRRIFLRANAAPKGSVADLRMAPDYDAVVQLDFAYPVCSSHSVKTRSCRLVADQTRVAAGRPEPNIVCPHKDPVFGQKLGQQGPGTTGRSIAMETGRCGAALFAAQEAANRLKNLAPSGRGASGHPVLALPLCMLAMRPSRGVRLSRDDHWVQRVALAVRSRFCIRRSASSLVVAAVALAGCALNEGPGQLAVDPGRYELYHCADLASRFKVLQARENELRTLMAKAGESGGGALVGTLAYRADYETVLSEEKLLQRTAAEKKCEVGPPPAFQSDQAVR